MTRNIMHVLYMNFTKWSCFSLKKNISQVKNVAHFSNKCVAQYEIFKASLNYCHHQYDFEFGATWIFLAISPGKSPYEEFGGTFKRKILKLNLQRPVDNEILTFRTVKDFCQTSITSIILM